MDLTEKDYELLSQYLDRELAADALQLLEQRLAVEPQLAASLTRLQALNSRLQGAFSGPALETVPANITALLQREEPQRIVPLPHRRVQHWGFALAASLVVAVSAALVYQGGSNSVQTGIDPALSLALEHSTSSGTDWEMLADGRQLRAVLSFQSRDGNWCREYLVADKGNNAGHGIACRGDNGWANTVLAEATIQDSANQYRPASATDSDQIADYINLNAADIPLDAAQEAELISRNWQQ